MAARLDPVFKAVSDPTRRAMLDLLRVQERTATELAAPFAISQPASSRHLKVLRQAGLVRAVADGRSRVYRLQPEPLRAVFDWAEHYQRFWTDKLAGLGTLLDEIDEP